jgi:hypothetical protein
MFRGRLDDLEWRGRAWVREKEERILFSKPRERKRIGNERFWSQNHLNTPFASNYHYALALSVFD